MNVTTKIQIKPDDELNELFASLKEIEDYSDEFINRTSGQDTRKIFVLGIFAACIQYASSIRRLNQDRPSAKVSNVFLRSLFEGWGNLEYITLRGDDWYVLRDLQESYRLMARSKAYMEDFFSEHNAQRVGTQHISQVRANMTKAEKAAERMQQRIDKLEIEEGAKYSKKIFERFQAVDAVNAPEDLALSAYFNYLYLYPHLSADIHLGVEGASRWIEVDGDTIRTNHSGEALEDVKRVCWTALALIKDITVLTMKEFDLYDQDFDEKYQEVIERMR